MTPSKWNSCLISKWTFKWSFIDKIFMMELKVVLYRLKQTDHNNNSLWNTTMLESIMRYTCSIAIDSYQNSMSICSTKRSSIKKGCKRTWTTKLSKYVPDHIFFSRLQDFSINHHIICFACFSLPPLRFTRPYFFFRKLSKCQMLELESFRASFMVCVYEFNIALLIASSRGLSASH